MQGGLCLSSAKKTAGTKGKRNLPRAGHGGETEALPLQCSLFSKHQVMVGVSCPSCPPAQGGLSPDPIHCFPRDAAGPELPVGAALAAAAQAASSKELTAPLSHHIMMDEPCPMEMSLSEQIVSSLLSASHLSVEPAGMNSSLFSQRGQPGLASHLWITVLRHKRQKEPRVFRVQPHSPQGLLINRRGAPLHPKGEKEM